MKLTVLAIGKLREAWVKDGCEEYARRVRAKTSFEIVEVKDVSDIGRRLPSRARKWVLDERGKELTSAELASALKRAMDTGESGLAFVIGGADGLPPEVISQADFCWSLGRLTLPHRLARLILLEQLYRALSILRGEPYHRA